MRESIPVGGGIATFWMLVVRVAVNGTLNSLLVS